MTPSAPHDAPPGAGAPQSSPRSPHWWRLRLRRDTRHKVLGGVAAGVAREFGMDIAIVRVLFVLAAIFWIGIPVYIVAWIIIPSEDGTSPFDDRPRDAGMIAALALIAIGSIIVVDHLLPNGWHHGTFIGPALLIAGGVAILLVRRPLPPGAEGELAAPEPPRDAESPWTQPADRSAETAGPADDTQPLPPSPPRPPDPPWSAWTQTHPWPHGRDWRRTARHEHRAHRPRSFLGPLTLSVLFIGAGIASLLQATGAVDINLTVALGLATLFVGAMLVVSAFFGRARSLVFVGAVLAIATSIASAVNVPISGGFGEEIHRPTTAAAVESSYQLAIGHLVVDLRHVQFAHGGRDIKASIGIGRLEIDVPATTQVTVNAHVGAGHIDLFGHGTGGWHEDAHATVGTAAPNELPLIIDARVGAGEIDVHRYQPDGSEILSGGS